MISPYYLLFLPILEYNIRLICLWSFTRKNKKGAFELTATGLCAKEYVKTQYFMDEAV